MLFFQQTEFPVSDTPPATRDVTLPFVIAPELAGPTFSDRDEDAVPFLASTVTGAITIQAADAVACVIFVNSPDLSDLQFTWTGAGVPQTRSTFTGMPATLAASGGANDGWFAILAAGETITLTATADATIRRIAVGNLIGSFVDWPLMRGKLLYNERLTNSESGLVHRRRNAQRRLTVSLSFKNHGQQADADLMTLLSDSGQFNCITLSQSRSAGSEWQRGDICRTLHVTRFQGFEGYSGIAVLGPSGRVDLAEPPAAKTNLTTFPPAPAVPTGLGLTVTTNTGIAVDWDDVVGATSYEIQFATDAGFTSPSSVFVSSSAGDVTGLTLETQYFVKVRAINAGGISAFTAA